MSVDVEQLLLAQQLRLAKMQNSMTARQLRLIEAAMLEIAARLSGPGAGTWGHAERMATMQMLARSLQQMTTTQLGALTLDLRRVSWLAKTDTATYLATLDKHFTGSVHPLRFDTLSWWEGAQKDIGRVRLREYSRSFQRYGAAITSDIEDILAKTILIGEPWTEARDKVWAATRSVINKNDYRIDRLIRTESSAAWNGTTQAALLEEDQPDDPMFKKLITHFDGVTGRDSVMLHGQTRHVKKPFYDAVNGISYMAPPNRPNDREIVVGWRKRYGDHFDDFDKELSIGYDPEIHGPRKVLQSGKAVDPTGPMTRARPKRRKPLHFKPTERKRREQLSRLESERSALMDQLKRTKAQVRLLKRQANLFTGEHGTLIGDSATTTAEMAKTLTRQVEERTQWIQALRAGY